MACEKLVDVHSESVQIAQLSKIRSVTFVYVNQLQFRSVEIVQ